jgi:hypothetical protein
MSAAATLQSKLRAHSNRYFTLISDVSSNGNIGATIAGKYFEQRWSLFGRRRDYRLRHGISN